VVPRPGPSTTTKPGAGRERLGVSKRGVFLVDDLKQIAIADIEENHLRLASVTLEDDLAIASAASAVKATAAGDGELDESSGSKVGKLSGGLHVVSLLLSVDEADKSRSAANRLEKRTIIFVSKLALGDFGRCLTRRARRGWVRADSPELKRPLSRSGEPTQPGQGAE
jgi:hypothetical protein